MEGRWYCAECAEKVRRRVKELRDAGGREKEREAGRRLYAKRKEEGLCVKCGSAADGALCALCRKKGREYERIRYKKKHSGTCYICNARPALEGKRICAACYEKKRRIMERIPGGKYEESDT